jgi:uncharacterized protein (DUF2062 family)
VFSVARLRDQLRQVLHLNEPPHRTALAFAVGAFIAFSPTYGLHTLSVFFLAWAFRLNAAAVLAGSLINNPWTVVPILGATVWAGFRCLGMPQIPPFDWNDLSVRAIYAQILPYAVPFIVGGFVLSLIAAGLGYVAAYLVIKRYRARFGRSRRTEDRLPPGRS